MNDGRVSMRHVAEETVVTIGPSKNLVNGCLSLVITIFGLLGIAAVGSALVMGDEGVGPKLFFAGWVLGAGLITAVACANFLAVFWMRWELTISPESLLVHWQLPLLSRSRTFARSGIRDVRIKEARGRGGLRSRFIVFEHGSKTRYATPKLSDTQLRELMHRPLAELIAEASAR